MLTLTASGSVSDYSDNDKSSLQQKIAAAAGVDKPLVTIRVAAGSVIITARVAVPAATLATAVQALLSTLDTAEKASKALGITVEGAPTITIESSVPPSPPSPVPLPPLWPPSPPQTPPSSPLAPFADEPCTNSNQEDRCKVTLKIEARLLPSPGPCTFDASILMPTYMPP